MLDAFAAAHSILSSVFKTGPARSVPSFCSVRSSEAAVSSEVRLHRVTFKAVFGTSVRARGLI